MTNGVCVSTRPVGEMVGAGPPERRVGKGYVTVSMAERKGRLRSEDGGAGRERKGICVETQVLWCRVHGGGGEEVIILGLTEENERKTALGLKYSVRRKRR